MISLLIISLESFVQPFLDNIMVTICYNMLTNQLIELLTIVNIFC